MPFELPGLFIIMDVRLFIAVEITGEIRKKLAEFQDELKKVDADAGWVAPENLHITLKFIGYIDEEKIDAVTSIIKDSLTHIKPFDLRLCRCGYFTDGKKSAGYFC